MEKVDLSIFNLSPMAMWIQDFSAVKKYSSNGLMMVFKT